jgi:hypothetical protein
MIAESGSSVIALVVESGWWVNLVLVDL